jgi:hypothetical protein
MSKEHHTLAGTTARQYLNQGRHLVNGVFSGGQGAGIQKMAIREPEGSRC